jgi:hypothetical protein
MLAAMGALFCAAPLAVAFVVAYEAIHHRDHRLQLRHPIEG